MLTLISPRLVTFVDTIALLIGHNMSPALQVGFQAELARSFFKHFINLDTAMYLGGLILLTMGGMAWALYKPGNPRRSWGMRLFGIGSMFVLVGANIGWFMSLVYYALNQ